jgi:alkylation response protein AidB-like acyl-CoA dehydrogenase
MSFIPEKDLSFLLYDWLGAEELKSAPYFSDHSRETFDAFLDVSAKLASSHFANHYKKSDRVEPRLESGKVFLLPEAGEALRVAAKIGLFSADFDAAHGGYQYPKLIQTAAMAHIMAANIATSAFIMLTQGNARVICSFGTDMQIEHFAKPQIEGRWFGTMCLSEPQAGSSLADIVTKAVFEKDEQFGPRYRISGNKMWISGGDHELSENIVHLVLAKVPDAATGQVPPGVRGISLFIVPKILPDGTRNDIAVAGLNHKMGYRGISNCLLNFGEGQQDRPEGLQGAIGFRIGPEGTGLAQMFQMMNEARIAVGLGAASLAQRGYVQSLSYAKERHQGRSGSSKNKSAKQDAIITHPDVKRMLLAQKALAEGGIALILYCAKLVDAIAIAKDDDERDELQSLLDLLTPVAKSWPSEFGLVANDLAIQLHGGYGYTRDFDVEQLYRDNRLNPIHEGTHGIQGIDLVNRKILKDGRQAFDVLGLKVADTIARAKAHKNLVQHAQTLAAVWQSASATVSALSALSDPNAPVHNASLFLSAFGHLVVGWLWLDQALTLSLKESDDDWLRGKLKAVRYFFDAELPKAELQFSFVQSGNDVAASCHVDEF